MERYSNRTEAGVTLAHLLKQYRATPNGIVLALPRGGVPVAFEIAHALSLPLDVFIVRKLGVPYHVELAMGAIATGGHTVFNQSLIKALHITQSAIDTVIQQEQEELERRELLYRGTHPAPPLQNKTIILVDDGIATGASMRAAIKSIQQQHPKKLIVAVPVAAQDTVDELTPLVDEFICPLSPKYFNAVGLWYQDFSQTTDEEVIQLLSLSH